MIAHHTHENELYTSTSHTIFRMDFARTHTFATHPLHFIIHSSGFASLSKSLYAPLSQYLLLCHTTYHGLRTPNKAFFYRNPKLLGLGRQIGQINFGAFRAFGVFLSNLSTPTLAPWVPCPCFPLINHYFYKKVSLYIQIKNIYEDWDLNLGRKELGI